MLGLITSTRIVAPLHNTEIIEVDTPSASHQVLVGDTVTGRRVAVKRRSDVPLPPHAIDHADNLRALLTLGVDQVIGTSMVGSLRPDLLPGALLVPDQMVEWSSAGPHTAYTPEAFGFADLTDPYCPRIRASLNRTLAADGLLGEEDGTYFSVMGPRYETAAEVRMFRMLGGSVVGQTNGPECIAARELGMCYATLALITNLGAGLAKSVRIEHVGQSVDAHGVRMGSVLGSALSSLDDDAGCRCHRLPTMFGEGSTMELPGHPVTTTHHIESCGDESRNRSGRPFASASVDAIEDHA